MFSLTNNKTMTVRDNKTGKEKLTIYDFKPTTIEDFYIVFDNYQRETGIDIRNNPIAVQMFIDQTCQEYEITVDKVHEFDINIIII